MNRRTPLTRTPMPPGDPAKALSRRVALSSSSSAPLRARGRDSRATGRGGMGQPKAGPKGEFSAAVRLAVRKRAGRGDEFEAKCEACGRWLGRDAGEHQHRDARGMGGSRDPVVNGPAGCALLCRECHMLAEARDRNMLGMGFWLENGQDPRTAPIMLHGKGGSRMTVYLAEDGLGPDGTGYVFQRPAVAA